MAQGGQKPDGFFARQVLGRDVNALLSRLHYEEHAGLADTGTANILGSGEVHGIAAVIDRSNNLAALVEIQGDGGGTAILAQSGTHFNGVAGNAGTVNIYYSTDHYEVENQTGGAVDLDVITLREP